MSNRANAATYEVGARLRLRGGRLLPGLVIAALGTLAAAFVSNLYGAPLTLMALLFGLSLNFLADDSRLAPGLSFATHTLLRFGIVLAGTRVTAGQVAALGPVALLCVAGIAGATICTGIWMSRRLGLGGSFGLLAGGAVAICGTSAAMAIAAAIGNRRVGEAQLTLVLVAISAMSAAAMILYPMASHLLRLNDVQAGLLLGASIHDVAQALGAGYSYSEAAGQIAAIVKLTRVALLAPLLAAMPLLFARGKGDRHGPPLPWFVIGFFLTVAANSLGMIPPATAQATSGLAAALLAAAVTATAVRTPLGQLRETGVRPLIVMSAATLAAFALALAAALVAV